MRPAFASLFAAPVDQAIGQGLGLALSVVVALVLALVAFVFTVIGRARKRPSRLEPVGKCYMFCALLLVPAYLFAMEHRSELAMGIALWSAIGFPFLVTLGVALLPKRRLPKVRSKKKSRATKHDVGLQPDTRITQVDGRITNPPTGHPE